jgi:hypothetical protein
MASESVEYHKIETLYERDEATHRLKPELILKNPVYGIIKSWQFTEKIDGTNIRCIWNPVDKVVSFRGRSDNASTHPALLAHLQESVLPSRLAEVFPDSPAILYGEGYGAGIQKGGGLYSETKKFILFDVLVAEKWWLNWAATCDVAAKLNIETVPYFGEMTLEEGTEIVRAGFPSRLNGGKAQAEGLVGRPLETLFDKKGARLIIKLKTRDF